MRTNQQRIAVAILTGLLVLVGSTWWLDDSRRPDCVSWMCGNPVCPKQDLGHYAGDLMCLISKDKDLKRFRRERNHDLHYSMLLPGGWEPEHDHTCGADGYTPETRPIRRYCSNRCKVRAFLRDISAQNDPSEWSRSLQDFNAQSRRGDREVGPVRREGAFRYVEDVESQPFHPEARRGLFNTTLRLYARGDEQHCLLLQLEAGPGSQSSSRDQIELARPLLAGFRLI